MIGISQRRALLNYPCFLHIYVSSSTAKRKGGKKTFRKAMDRSVLQPAILFIIRSTIMAKDCLFRMFIKYPCAILCNKYQKENNFQFTLINIINLYIYIFPVFYRNWPHFSLFIFWYWEEIKRLLSLIASLSEDIFQKAKCISLNNRIQLKWDENIFLVALQDMYVV